ncbi:monosaccharide-transporting ATPase [Candidatus Vecturithrix granuli]|uniref:Monosaccharide-transporting ATPase n=1 Tax=Vecturithrix granuli TaxID=1499967 RepID=A0A081C3I8_VECG1|nr:monosaccharide-transporting ATPase [Candidatus Vecturithrix granuli]
MKLRFTDPTVKYLLIILVILVLGFELIIPGQRFFKFSTFQSMAFQVPELGILAIAMMITMLSGGINLSIIATSNMTALISAYILTRFIPEGTGAISATLIIITAIAAGLLMALLIGVLNGLIIAYIGVSPILTTLGTMTLVEGLNVALTRGDVISGFPEPILFLGNGKLLGVPMPLLIFAACALIATILLNRTPFGVSIYMLGSNEKATLFSGIQTQKVLVKIYALSGLLCGVSAIIMIARFNSANAGYASSYLLVTILASVLGGVNPDGGFGKIFGLVLSLIVLQVISSGLNLLGFSAHLTIALWGSILIVVISLHHLRGWLSKATA